jgi:hypothetical protein
MQMKNSKAHWENIYQTKKFSEVSWYQEIPETSLKIIRSFNLPKSAKIIDVGGGDSYLVDFLLEEVKLGKILFPKQQFASSLYKAIESKYFADLSDEGVRKKIASK